MSPSNAILHVLRLTLEAVTPLSPSAGASLALQDNVLARDANGLPILLGTSLAGVLRHTHRARFSDKDTKTLFGDEVERETPGQASRLELSHGYVHDQNDRPVAGRVTRAEIDKDVVLAHLAQDRPVRRDGVALDHRGVAVENKKFDRTSLPAGTRFTLELTMEGNPDDLGQDRATLCTVAALFDCPTLRLGGATRRGLGKVRILADRTAIAAFDRADPTGWAQYAAWRSRSIGAHPGGEAGFTPHRLDPPLPCDLDSPPPCDALGALVGEVSFTFDGWWRFGQGDKPIGLRPADVAPDQIPAQEVKITYGEGGGRLCNRITIAGSGIKGALAHRTAFHARRLRGAWAEGCDGQTDPDQDPVIAALFGSVKRNDDSKNTGRAGSVLIDDISLDSAEVEPGLITHTSIDRFTQGVRNRVLFKEQSLWRGEIQIPITILAPRCAKDGVNDPDWDAACTGFAYALRDLVDGRLALGADSGDGHGYGTGRLCPKLDEWVRDQINRHCQHAQPTRGAAS